MYKEDVTTKKTYLSLSPAEEMVVKYLIPCLNHTTAARFEAVEFNEDPAKDALSRFIVRARENYAYELYLWMRDEGKTEEETEQAMRKLLAPIYEEMYGTATRLTDKLFAKDLQEARKWFGKLEEMRAARKCRGYSIRRIPDM